MTPSPYQQQCEQVIEVKEGDDIRLIIPGNNRTCVYVSLCNGLISISGGASIIDSIEGKGMMEKIMDISHSSQSGCNEILICSYCGSHYINKSYLCGPGHPSIFSGYNCTWCGTRFDRDMIIIEIGRDHENSVEYERKKRERKSWDYSLLCSTSRSDP